MSRMIQCPECRGIGAIKVTHDMGHSFVYERCPHCDGEGAIADRRAHPEPMVPLRLVEDVQRVIEDYLKQHHCFGAPCSDEKRLRKSIRDAIRAAIKDEG